MIQKIKSLPRELQLLIVDQHRKSFFRERIKRFEVDHATKIRLNIDGEDMPNAFFAHASNPFHDIQVLIPQQQDFFVMEFDTGPVVIDGGQIEIVHKTMKHGLRRSHKLSCHRRSDYLYMYGHRPGHIHEAE